MILLIAMGISAVANASFSESKPGTFCTEIAECTKPDSKCNPVEIWIAYERQKRGMCTPCDARPNATLNKCKDKGNAKSNR